MMLTDLVPKVLGAACRSTKTYSIVALFIDFGDWIFALRRMATRSETTPSI